jgi:hypothetical protein
MTWHPTVERSRLLGTTAVYREYARLLHAALVEKGLATLSLGAPECVMQTGAKEGWTPDPRCTGLEQLVIRATRHDRGPRSRADERRDHRVRMEERAQTDRAGRYVLRGPAAEPARKRDRPVLRGRGVPLGICGVDGVFTCRPTLDQNYSHCTTEPKASPAALPDTQKQLETVLGKGKPESLPADLRDPRSTSASGRRRS